MNVPKHWEMLPMFWQGIGSPFHPLTPKVVGNRCGVYRHEMDAEVAEYRLRHDGILPELEQYVAGICREAVR